MNQEMDRAGRGEGNVLQKGPGAGAWWDPSPGCSLLTATVVDGGWPWQERRPPHAPALTGALGSCLCSWDHKNSWDKFLACSASLCLRWRKCCQCAGQKVLGELARGCFASGGGTRGRGMSSACSHRWSSMKSRAFKDRLVLGSTGWLLAFPLPCPSGDHARAGLGSCHLQLASDPHPGRTFWLMAATEQYHARSRLPQAREITVVEVGKSCWRALLQPAARPSELMSLS